MSRNIDPGEWHVATDRERIVDWAEAHGAVPVCVEREADPGDAPGERALREPYKQG